MMGLCDWCDGESASTIRAYGLYYDFILRAVYGPHYTCGSRTGYCTEPNLVNTIFKDAREVIIAMTVDTLIQKNKYWRDFPPVLIRIR